MPDPAENTVLDKFEQDAAAERKRLLTIAGPSGPITGERAYGLLDSSSRLGVAPHVLARLPEEELRNLDARVRANDFVLEHELAKKDAPLTAAIRESNPMWAKSSAVDVEDVRAQREMEFAARASRNIHLRPDGVVEIHNEDGQVTAAFNDVWKYKSYIRDARNAAQEQEDQYMEVRDQGFFGLPFNVASTNFRLGALRSATLSATALGLTNQQFLAASANLSDAVGLYQNSFSDDVVQGLGGFFADAPLMLTGGIALRGLKSLAVAATGVRALQGLGAKTLFAAASAAPGLANSASAASAVGTAMNVASKAGSVFKSVAGNRFADSAFRVMQGNLPLAGRGLLASDDSAGFAVGEFAIEMLVPTLFGRTGTERVLANFIEGGIRQAEKQSLSKFATFARGFLGDVSLEGTEEALTEFGHAMHEYLSGQDPNALDGSTLFRRMATAFTVGAVAGGAFTAIGKYNEAQQQSLYENLSKLSEVTTTAEQSRALDAMISSGSKTAAADQETTAGVLRSASADGRLFIDREAIAKIALDNNTTPEAVAKAITGSESAWASGSATNTPIEYSIAALHSRELAALAPIVKGASSSRPGGMTFQDADAAAANAQKTLDDLANGNVPSKQEQQDQNDEAALQKVFDEISTGLQAVGYDVKQAERGADLQVAAFRSIARRAGISIANLHQKFTNGRGIVIERTKVGRGSFSAKESTIRLSNSSTVEDFVHESAHMFAEIVKVASGMSTDPAIKALEADIARAFKVKSLSDISEDNAEEFAESFVNWIKTGEAKVKGMEVVFQAFSNFMRNLFTRFVNMNPRYNRELVSSFEAIFAFEEDVAVMEQSFGLDFASREAAQKYGLPASVAAEYQARVEALRERVMNHAFDTALDEGEAKELESRRASIERDMESEMDGMMQYRAMAYASKNPINRDQFIQSVRTIATSRAKASGITNTTAYADAQVAEAMDIFGGMTSPTGVPITDVANASYPVNPDGSRAGPTPTVDEMVDAMLHAKPRAAALASAVQGEMAAQAAELLSGRRTAARLKYSEAYRQIRQDMVRSVIQVAHGNAKDSMRSVEEMGDIASLIVGRVTVRNLRPANYLAGAQAARRKQDRILSSNSNTIQATTALVEAIQQEALALACFNKATAAVNMVRTDSMRVNGYAKPETQRAVFKAGGSQFVTTDDDANVIAFDSEADAVQSGRQYAMTTSPLSHLNAVLHVHGFNRPQAAMQDINAALDWAAKNGMEIKKAVQSFKDLTVAEFQDAVSMADFLVTRAKDVAAFGNAESKRARDETINGMLAHTKDRKDASSGWTAGVVRSFAQFHRFTRGLLTDLDKSLDGPYFKAIMAPMRLIRAVFEANKRETQGRWIEAANEWRNSGAASRGTRRVRRSMKDPKAGTIDIESDQIPIIIAHMGAQSNRERLYATLGVDVVNQVLQFATPADYAFATQYQKILSSRWAERQAVDRRSGIMTAVKLETSEFIAKRYNETTGEWIDDPSIGTVTAGYMPALYDEKTQFMGSNDADIMTSINTVIGTASGSGASKARAESAPPGMKLSLDPMRYVNESIRNDFYVSAAFELRNMASILTDRRVQNEITRISGTSGYAFIRQAVIDFANRGPVASSAADKFAGDFASYLRGSTSYAMMAYNPVTAITQSSGVLNAAIADPRVAKFLVQAVASPTEAWKIARADPRVAARAFSQEAQDAKDKIETGKNAAVRAYGKIVDNGFILTSAVQSGVDAVVYAAAYNSAIARNKPEGDARNEAYDFLLRTQASGYTEDLSPAQKAAITKLFTIAYTYGATVFNNVMDNFTLSGNDVIGRSVAFLKTIGFVSIPCAMAVAMKDALKSDDEDEDENPSFFAAVGMETLSSFVGSMVIVREFSGVVQGYDLKSGLFLSGPVAAYNAANTAIKAAAEGEADARLTRDLIKLGQLFTLPSTQIWRIVQTAIYDPDDLRGYISGLPQSSKE